MAVFGLYSAGQDKQAIAAAQAINQAQQIYLLRVSGAATAWSNAGSDDANTNARNAQILNQLVSIAAVTGATIGTGAEPLIACN